MKKPTEVKKFSLLVIAAILISSCNQEKPKMFDTQGHRGCRGLMPENTIPAFKKALEIGVKTLEMDVVITSDNEVVLSHDPYLSHEMCSDSNGNRISEESEKSYRIYGMTFAELQHFDCGKIPHPRFPDQQKMEAKKPLLSSVIDSSEAYAKKLGRDLPFYNIETKSTVAGDAIFHPKPDVFAQLLLDVVFEKGIENRFILQSFDVRTLQYTHQKYPNIKLALLVENNQSIEENIEVLGFNPDIYSPDYNLLTKSDIKYCKEHNMQLIPWTVNEKEDMQYLIDLGVDGIISDYPDRLMDVVKL